MITKFDRAACRLLSDEIAAAVAAIAAKHGLTAVPAGGTIGIGALDFTAKTTFKVTNAEAVDAVERAAFTKWCGAFKLSADKYLAKFEHKGERFALVGFNMGSRQYPVTARKLVDGKTYKFADGILALVR